MSALKKIMNEEIKKYQGRIYYLDVRFGMPSIEPANWIFDTSCYDHFSFELHHVIKFTQFEKNKKWFTERGLNMCLILIPKVLHQHLENPVYELPEEVFYNKYGIHKYKLLFNKTEYDKGNYPAILTKDSTEISFEDVDLSFFADCEQSVGTFSANNQAEGVC